MARGTSIFNLSMIPMLARPTERVPTENYAYEVKWDGVRALAYIENRQIRIVSRNLLEITVGYPELTELAHAATAPLIIDGEIVALDKNGLPSFGQLQHRMHVRDSRTAQKLSRDNPVTYMIFDILNLNGNSTMELPYLDRRAQLQALKLEGKTWKTPEHFTGKPQPFIEATRKLGLEGIIAKQCTSTYRPGIRSNDWLKVKNVRRQEFIVAGWQDGQGSREGVPGALLMGYYDITGKDAKRAKRPQKLVYAGKVGTGFSSRMLSQLHGCLSNKEIKSNPFDVYAPHESKTHFVQPELVAEVQYAAWTDTHMLRHASFLGLREDKSAREVVLES